MALEALLVRLLEALSERKESTPRGPLARNYAVLNTEIEKAYAYYLLYVCPHEADTSYPSDIPGKKDF